MVDAPVNVIPYPPVAGVPMKNLTFELKKNFPDKNVYQIGETFGSDELILSYVNPAELNAQFNFDIYCNYCAGSGALDVAGQGL